MADGMNSPVKPSKFGGVEFLKGQKQKGKILRHALYAGDDKNPFQSLGASEKVVFQVDNARSAADMKLEVQRIVDKFSGKIAINPDTPITVFRDPEKGLGVEFQWIDLETNELSDFQGFVEQPGG